METNQRYKTNTNLINPDQYHADIQSIIDSYVTSADPIPSALKHQKSSCCSNGNTSSSLMTFNRDPAVSEHLTDELRWLLIQCGPHQPRDDDHQFVANEKLTKTKKGIVRFRTKWFDDVRFSDWLEYSLSTSRAYCFYCRLFADSNRNRAFSRDGQLHRQVLNKTMYFLCVLYLGIQNWRKCLGSRGQKKRRSTSTTYKTEQDTTACQRRGLLESHALSESHKQAYQKYLAFVEQMHMITSTNKCEPHT
jgi:hypothetical protein